MIVGRPDGKGYTMEAALQLNWCNPRKEEEVYPDGQLYFRGAMDFRSPADWTVMRLAERAAPQGEAKVKGVLVR